MKPLYCPTRLLVREVEVEVARPEATPLLGSEVGLVGWRGTGPDISTLVIPLLRGLEGSSAGTGRDEDLLPHS